MKITPRTSSIASWARLGQTIAIALSSALSTSACVSIEADVQELSVTRNGITFDAAPTLASQTEGSVTQSFTVNGPLLELPNSIKSDVYATNTKLSLRKGAPDLSFLHTLLITVEPTDNPSSTSRTLLSYERADNAVVGQSLEIPVQDSTSALSELTADSVSYNLTAAGTLPTEVWALDITVFYRGKFTVEP